MLSNKCTNILFSAVFPYEIPRDNHISWKKRKRVSSSMNKLTARRTRRGDSREIIASIVRNANCQEYLSLSFFSCCWPISRSIVVFSCIAISYFLAIAPFRVCPRASWLCLSRENRDRFAAFSSLSLPRRLLCETSIAPRTVLRVLDPFSFFLFFSL